MTMADDVVQEFFCGCYYFCLPHTATVAHLPLVGHLNYEIRFSTISIIKQQQQTNKLLL